MSKKSPCKNDNTVCGGGCVCVFFFIFIYSYEDQMSQDLTILALWGHLVVLTRKLFFFNITKNISVKNYLFINEIKCRHRFN